MKINELTAVFAKRFHLVTDGQRLCGDQKAASHNRLYSSDRSATTYI